MRALFVLLFLQAILAIPQTSLAQSSLYALRTENLENPHGIETLVPRFSWKWQSTKKNLLQSAYEIRVAEIRSGSAKTKAMNWASGKIASQSSVLVPYTGPALTSGTSYFWQVRAWDQDGKATAWTKPAKFQMGLLNPADWMASWIEPGYPEDSITKPSPLMRKSFSLPKKVLQATLFITSLGMYEAYLNGQKVGDDYLTPGWTSYKKRVQYQQYDVTLQLKQGANVIGAMLGSGWYRGYIGFSGQQNFYGKKLALKCQLQVIYTDGSTETIVSDDSWTSSTGSVQSSEIYHGESIDARKEPSGWNNTGFDDAGWTRVKIRTDKTPEIVSTYNTPVRKHETETRNFQGQSHYPYTEGRTRN